MSKTVIKNTPSGPIELHFDGRQMILQFNCDCKDALPMCHASCCRLRPFYNVGIQKEEAEKYLTEQHPENPELTILQHANGHCVYLDHEESLCKTHDDKPCICKSWHCSPLGGGDQITQRDNGWVLLPLKPEQPEGHTDGTNQSQ